MAAFLGQLTGSFVLTLLIYLFTRNIFKRHVPTGKWNAVVTFAVCCLFFAIVAPATGGNLTSALLYGACLFVFALTDFLITLFRPQKSAAEEEQKPEEQK